MAPAQQQQRKPPRRSIAPEVAAGAAAGGAATTALGAAAAIYAQTKTVQFVARNLAKALLSTVIHIGIIRGERIRQELFAEGLAPEDVERLMAREKVLESEYLRRSKDRVLAGVRLAVRAPDTSAQGAAIEQVITREQRFAGQHGEAQVSRLRAAVEREKLRVISPQGAYWELGPAKEHTPDCLAMAGKVWPWSVLDKLLIPLHPGCVCHLRSIGDAIASGLITPGDLMTDEEAQRQAQPIIDYVTQVGNHWAKESLQEISLGSIWRAAAHPRGAGGLFRDTPDQPTAAPEPTAITPSELGGAPPRGPIPPVPDPNEEPEDVGDDIDRAATLIAKGRAVRLEQPEQVSTLLTRLGDMAKDAEARGNKAPHYDLCKVSVKGTNLFCSESKGIPRVQMPQLKGVANPGSQAAKLDRADQRGETDITEEFIAHLKEKGYAASMKTVPADHLRATQRELDGVTVAGITGFLRGGGSFEGQPPLVVSREDYILDGHHRWASEVALDLEDNVPGDITMDVQQFDISIAELLAEAVAFADKWGLPQVGVGEGPVKEARTKVGPYIRKGKLVNLSGYLRLFDPTASSSDIRSEVRALDPNDQIVVFHSTDRKTADRMMADGIDPELKPTNLARQRYEAGEPGAVFEPGRGLSPGLTVAAKPGDTGGFGEATLAVKVRVGDITPSPEQENLGATDAADALSVGDAQVLSRIPPEDIIEVTEPGKDPAVIDDVADRVRPLATAPTPDLAVRLRPDQVEFDSWNGGWSIKGTPFMLDGKVVSKEETPTLYHVTTARSAVEASGELRGVEGVAGLGSFGEHKYISFTSDPEIARKLNADMKFVTNLSHDHGISRPGPNVRTGRESFFDEGVFDALEAQARSEGWEYNRQGEVTLIHPVEPGSYTHPSPEENEYTCFDVLSDYFAQRERNGGPQDPYFAGFDVADWQKIDPNEIATIEVSPEQVHASGAVVTELGGLLGEYRVFGDVPVGPTKTDKPPAPEGNMENRWVQIPLSELRPGDVVIGKYGARDRVVQAVTPAGESSGGVPLAHVELEGPPEEEDYKEPFREDRFGPPHVNQIVYIRPATPDRVELEQKQRNTVRLAAYGSEEDGYSLKATLDFSLDERDKAEALVAQFPKSWRVKTSGVSSEIGNWPTVTFGVQLVSTGVTGEKNEAGWKRWEKFATKMREQGYDFELVGMGGSNYLPPEHPIYAPALASAPTKKDKPPAPTTETNWLGQPLHHSAIHRRGEEPPPITVLITDRNTVMGSKKYGSPALGRLLTPQSYESAGKTEEMGVPFACDNDGYNAPERDSPEYPAYLAKYHRMVEAVARSGAKPLWVTVPDVLRHNADGSVTGDAAATIAAWPEGHQYLEDLGLPSAFVAQDGMDSPENLRWLEEHIDEMACIFIGGSDEFKLGPGAAAAAEVAHRHGKLLHVGRVNTQQRVAYARDVLEADSVDGSNLAKQKDANLIPALRMAMSGDAPPREIGMEWVSAAVRAILTGTQWPRFPTMSAPQWPHGFFPEPVAERNIEGTMIFFEPLSDALYRSGISDRSDLHFDPGVIGFSIDFRRPEQLVFFASLMRLPEPVVHGHRAHWPTVFISPEDGPESLAEDFNPFEKRDWHGRWMRSVSNTINSATPKQINMAVGDQHAIAQARDGAQMAGMEATAAKLEQARVRAVKTPEEVGAPPSPTTTEEIRRAVQDLGRGEVAEVSSAEFDAPFREALKDDPGYLTPYTPDELAQFRTFLAYNGKLGGALKPDGTIVSVFRLPGAPPGSGTGVMMRRLIAEGGTKLDCTGDKLRQLYERLGFKVTRRYEWNDDLADPRWDTATRGKPPIYDMSL